MDRFAAMTAFTAVADLKGFASAARKLRLSPSVVTRHVAALEDHLGIRLFQRTTRSVTLTDAGARYLERARRVLGDLEEAEGSAQAELAQPIGRFVVSAPATFGRLHVNPLMCVYLSRHPEVVGELLLTDRMVNLVEEGVDLAVRIGYLADSSLVVRSAGQTRRVAVASPAYLKKHGMPREPTDLAAHATILFTGITPVAEWRLYRNGQEERVAIAPRYLTNSAEAAIHHAERGGGITMVLAYQVAEAVAEKRLKIVLGDFEPAALPIQFVFPSSRLLSPKVRAFIDTATQTCDWSFDR